LSLYPKQLKFEETKRSALKGFIEEHTIKAPKDQKFDPKTFLMAAESIGKIKDPDKGQTCSEGENGKSSSNRP